MCNQPSEPFEFDSSADNLDTYQDLENYFFVLYAQVVSADVRAFAESVKESKLFLALTDEQTCKWLKSVECPKLVAYSRTNSESTNLVVSNNLTLL